jgi:hypothetical protein
MANRCELASGDHTCSRHYGGRGPSLKWLKPWVVRSPRRSRGRRQLNRSRFAVGAGSQKPQNQSARPDGMEPGPRWRRACRRRVYSPVAPTRGWPLATSAPTFCVTPSSGLSHQSSSSAAGPRSSSNVPSAPRNGQPISRCSHEAKKKRKRKAGWMDGGKPRRRTPAPGKFSSDLAWCRHGRNRNNIEPVNIVQAPILLISSLLGCVIPNLQHCMYVM